MPNGTIVQYIIDIDTGKAEKGLKSTSSGAKQAATQFDHLGQSSTKMNKKLKSTEKQAKRTSASFRNMRRAGRDLDGAFSDLGQGIGLISPAAGNLFMTLSSGASVTEGLGRSLMLFTNPAFAAAAIGAMAVAAAMIFWNKVQEEGKKKAERLTKSLEAANKVMSDQQKIIDDTTAKMASYINTLDSAKMNLDLLTGSITKLEAAQIKAAETAGKFRLDALEQNKKIMDALRKQIIAQHTISKNASNQYETQRAIEEASGKIVNGLSDRAKLLLGVANRQEQLLLNLKAQWRVAQNRNDEIKNQAGMLEDTLNKTAEITAENKKDAENKKQSDKDRRERLKREAEERKANLKEEKAIRKKIEDDSKAAQKDREKKTAALQALLKLENTILMKNATEREVILNNYRLQLQKVHELVDASGDLQAGANAENALLKEKNRLLEETKNNILEIASASLRIISDPSSLVTGAGGIMGMAGASDPASAAASTGGAILSSIASIGAPIGDAIEEAAAEGITLNEEQAEKVVLGNMNKAFSGFIKDLERGMSLLPEILVAILPDFVVSLVKVLAVDMQKLIAIDLPIALIKAIPEIVIAIINEIGFLLADMINGFKSALDMFRSFIAAIFSKEGRREAISDAMAAMKEFFESQFGGITAVKEAIQGFAGGGAFIPSAQGGMKFTGDSRSGLAMLHQNEFVVPASGQRPQSVDRQMGKTTGGVNIIINSPVVEQNAVDALVRRIEERFNSNFGLSSSDLFGGR